MNYPWFYMNFKSFRTVSSTILEKVLLLLKNRMDVDILNETKK